MPEFHLNRSNDVCVACGVSLGIFLSSTPVIATVGVNEWKGQLPKEIMHKRVLQRLPTLNRKAKSLPSCFEHAMDAVGIGHYLKDRNT